MNEESNRAIQLRSEESRDSELLPAKDGCRIALLTPYTGGNFGDAAIVDATIDQLRARIPSARFSGISLNCENFIERHGDSAFPLCGSIRPFYTMAAKTSTSFSGSGGKSVPKRGWCRHAISNFLHAIPGLAGALKTIRQRTKIIRLELRHSVRGYRFLHPHDLLIIDGGGQLDEEWGGPWGHPFALFKWSALARLARVPCEFVGVGASRVDSRLSRIFLSLALRMSRNRSYRDQHSKEIAVRLLRRAASDSVVPDIAFGTPPVDSLPSSVRPAAMGRLVVAVSPISYAKPGCWPQEDPALYRRYLDRMSQLIGQLLDREYFVVMVFSALSDANVIKEISSLLDERFPVALRNRLHVPMIRSWRDLVKVLQDVDIVVASRLHSAILSFVANKPTIAISFDKKVERIMEDLGQSEYLLQIRDFSVEDVTKALCRIEKSRNVEVEQIASFTQQTRRALELQFDLIARRAMET